MTTNLFLLKRRWQTTLVCAHRPFFGMLSKEEEGRGERGREREMGEREGCISGREN